MDIFLKRLIMKNRELIFPVLKTALILFVLGFICVLVSDEALDQLTPNHWIEHQLKIYKGWFFITLTAFLFYFIFRQQLKKAIDNKRDKALKESEERYKNIVETIHDLIWSCDMQGKILYINEACKKIYGYSPGEMIGQNFARFVPESQMRKNHEEFIARQKENFDTVELQTEIKHRDGRTFYLKDNVTVLRGKNGELTGMLGASKNITEKILAEKALYDSKNRLELALDGGGLGLWDFHVQPEELTVSEQWGQMLGFEKEVTNKSQTFRSLIHPDDKNNVDDAFHGCFKNHTTGFNMEYRIKHADGSWKWFLSKGKIMEWDKQGNPKRMVGINMDVTENKLLELELKRWVNIYSSFIKYSGEGIYLSELEKPMPISLPVDEQIKYFYKYGYVKTCNDALAKMYGYSKSEELTGIKLSQLHGGEDVPENIEFMRKFINSDYRIMQSVSREVDKEGNEIYFSNNVVGIIEDGELLRTWGSQSDITERKRAEDELQQRVEFERLVSKISSELVGVSNSNIDQVINNALAIIGTFTNASRAYVFKFKNGGKLMDNTHEWCAAGVKPQIVNLKNIVGDDELPWFTKHIQKHQVFHVSDVTALPPEARLEREHWEAQNIKSLIAVPMKTAGHLTGFIGFDCVSKRRVWTKDEQGFLRFVGQSLGSAQNRTQAEEALKESEEKFRLIAENSIDVIWKTDSRLKLLKHILTPKVE